MGENGRRFRGSLLIPALLIVLGVIFLLNNLGVLQGDVWGNLLRLWPVLLIVFGLDGILRQEGLVGPIFLIGVGVVFLLSNLGYLALDLWQLALRLWPILLIAFGLDIAIGRRSLAWSMMGLVILLALLAGALYLFGVGPLRAQPLASEEIRQPLQGASQARVVIKPAVGGLRLAALPDAAYLIQGTVREPRIERISQQFALSGSTATYTLEGSGSLNFGAASGGQWSWDLSLAPGIPVDLETSLGMGRSEIDLSGLTVSAIDLEIGIGEARVILPAEGRFEGNLEGAIGQMVIVVPQGAAVRINADTGISTVSAPPEFTRQEDVYTSPGYETAANRIDLDVSQAIGVLRIQQE